MESEPPRWEATPRPARHRPGSGRTAARAERYDPGPERPAGTDPADTAATDIPAVGSTAVGSTAQRSAADMPAAADRWGAVGTSAAVPAAARTGSDPVDPIPAARDSVDSQPAAWSVPGNGEPRTGHAEAIPEPTILPGHRNRDASPGWGRSGEVPACGSPRSTHPRWEHLRWPGRRNLRSARRCSHRR